MLDMNSDSRATHQYSTRDFSLQLRGVRGQGLPRRNSTAPVNSDYVDLRLFVNSGSRVANARAFVSCLASARATRTTRLRIRPVLSNRMADTNARHALTAPRAMMSSIAAFVSSRIG
jgi:hypothetical protein